MFLPSHGFRTLFLGFFIAVAATATSQAQVGPGWVLSDQKISSTEGGFPPGVLDANDEFGPVAALGDLDGDGNEDLVVGTPGDDDGLFGDNRGAVWVLFLNADGTVKAYQKISATAGGFTGTLDPLDHFGWNVGALGDLDGDGFEDVAVGTNADDDGGPNRGAVWILFLNGDGTVKAHQKISDTEGGFTGVLKDHDSFGYDMDPVGDLDGAGGSALTLAVSATYDDDGGANHGAVWILFLNTDGTVQSHQKISDTEGRFTGELGLLDRFGETVAGLGDLDGDGVADLAVGAAADDDGGEDRGAVWILFLDTDGTVKSHQKISDTEGGFTGALDDLDQFGISATGLGDLDGDGAEDVAVGAYRDDDGAPDCGAVWILFLDTDGTVKWHQKISATEGNGPDGLGASDAFSVTVDALGDLNDDGVIDLAAGAIFDDDGAFNAGAVWVLFLTEGVTGAIEEPAVAGAPPMDSHLVASVPNPFHHGTRVHYDLARPTDATIRVYDIAGRLVRSFDLSDRVPGPGSVDWDGKNDRGQAVVSGRYLVRLATPESADAIQVTLIK